MTNQFGVEVKGIEFHYNCGHRVAFMEPWPEFDPRLMERTYLRPDDTIGFSDGTDCTICKMNDVVKVI